MKKHWPLLLVVVVIAAAALTAWMMSHPGGLLTARFANDHDMVWIPGGTFDMGDFFGLGYPEDGETPVHRVALDGFWIDRHEVTNRQFARFVEETGYATEAEKYGWSGVPVHLLDEEQRKRYPADSEGRWPEHWRVVPGASWRHPEGPGSDIRSRLDHPVVHISWNDAVAYCAWLSKKTGARFRLPTEAEWEYAARGGLHGANLAWGNDLQNHGRWLCNIWQGTFPYHNTAEDGYAGTAPVCSYPPNGFGLYDVCGNVWEWCQDWFAPDYYQHSPARNPSGPLVGKRKVQRGGSYMCCDACCRRYRVSARYHNDPDSGMANTGFRCVREP